MNEWENDYQNLKMPSINLLRKRTITHLSDFEVQTLKSEIEDFFVYIHNINVRIVNYVDGFINDVFLLELGRGVRIQDVSDLKDDLSSYFKVPIAIVAPYKEKYVGILLSKSNAEPVSLRYLLEHDGRKIEGGMPIGANLEGEPLLIDLYKCGSILVAGIDDETKYLFLDAFIISSIYRYSSRELKYIFIDEMAVCLAPYRRIQHSISDVVKVQSDIEKKINWLWEKIEERKRKAANIGVKNISEYNEKDTILASLNEEKMPIIITVINNFDVIINKVNSETKKIIEYILRDGINFGVNLLMLTNRPTVDSVPGLMKSYSFTKIGIGIRNHFDYRVIFGNDSFGGVTQKYEIYYENSADKKGVYMICPFISEDERANVIDFVNEEYIYKNKHLFDAEKDENISVSSQHKNEEFVGSNINGIANIYINNNQLKANIKKIQIANINTSLSTIMICLLIFSGINISMIYIAIIGLAIKIVNLFCFSSFLEYSFEKEKDIKYEKFYNSWLEVKKNRKIWRVLSRENIIAKYNAGASNALKRKKVRITKKLPNYIKTNMKVIGIKMGFKKIYFLPDKILIMYPLWVKSVEYCEISIGARYENFIAEKWIPSDARSLPDTWLYVNTDGSPDRRFKNNRQVPVCEYGRMTFINAGRIEMDLICSNPSTPSVVAKNWLGNMRW